MRRVYLSFLGAGEYKEAIYKIGVKEARATRYVQCAEADILGNAYFDVFYIVATPTSKGKHFSALESELKQLGVTNITLIEISEKLEASNQWQWFENILTKIDQGDHLTIDMTHGFRAAPIVLSAAINFLQKSKKIVLNAVYYGAYENKDENGVAPIIDMKDFYIINEWAEAVSRLIEDADARKMAEIAGQAGGDKIGELNDQTIIDAFNDLTNTIRNVDINNVAKKTNAALALVHEKSKTASPTGKILLDLVIDKFVSISSDESISGNYDKAYFHLQLEIIRLLLEHRLYMQAFTVMREFVGSIGLIQVEKANMRKSDGFKQRNKADIFLRMLTNDEQTWNFDGAEDLKMRVQPFYDTLKNLEIETVLRRFCREMTDYRNGFDHAWTNRKESFSGIPEKGNEFYLQLKGVIERLESQNLIP